MTYNKELRGCGSRVLGGSHKSKPKRDIQAWLKHVNFMIFCRIKAKEEQFWQDLNRYYSKYPCFLFNYLISFPYSSVIPILVSKIWSNVGYLYVLMKHLPHWSRHLASLFALYYSTQPVRQLMGPSVSFVLCFGLLKVLDLERADLWSNFPRPRIMSSKVCLSPKYDQTHSNTHINRFL